MSGVAIAWDRVRLGPEMTRDEVNKDNLDRWWRALQNRGNFLLENDEEMTVEELHMWNEGLRNWRDVFSKRDVR